MHIKEKAGCYHGTRNKGAEEILLAANDVFGLGLTDVLRLQKKSDQYSLSHKCGKAVCGTSCH